MTAAQKLPTESAHATLSLLTGASTPASDLLDLWTVDSVIRHDIELRYVTETDSIKLVKTLMHVCDFSQIPVLSANRKQLKGSVTWKSLARFSSEGKSTAGEVMYPGGNTVELGAPLLPSIQTIIDNDFVYVRGGERGGYMSILTTTDLAESFLAVSGPFMKLREIEGRIRQLLRNQLSIKEIWAGLRAVDDPLDIDSVDSLTFGQYVELIESQDTWDQIGLPFDPVTIVKHLREVNQVRNRVMHFRPEPLNTQQSIVLDWCLNWLTECNTDGS